MGGDHTCCKVIAASLPNNSVKYKKDLQNKFFEQVDGDKLVMNEGLDLVKASSQKRIGGRGSLQVCQSLERAGGL